jgi:hypothetical protein
MAKSEHAVKELVEVTLPLAERNFDRRIQVDVQGELGQLAAYIETLLQNLRSLTPPVVASARLMPRVAKSVAQISQQAETSVNSILGLVDEMCVDQETISEMLDKAENGEAGVPDLVMLRQITDKNQTSLMSLMSFLSFQDVVRQQAEKVQVMIDSFDEKIRELLSKFKLYAPASTAEGESPRGEPEAATTPADDVVDQALIDDFFK